MKIDKNHILSVVEEIRRQLVGLTPLNVLMSWGISQFAATVIDDMPALRLKVNGRLHKGEVFIALNEGTDYYEIYLKNGNNAARKFAEDIDFTQLGETIDKEIESGTDKEEYARFCEEQRKQLFMGSVR